MVHLWRVDVWSTKCHVYGQDASDTQTFLGFSAHNLDIYLTFSLLFPFIRFLSLFSWRSRVFLFFKLSFLVLHYLVSSSCSSLLSCSYMVDYSFVSLILFILDFNCSPTFWVLGFHCLSQLFILASQLFHISQESLDLLLLYSVWLLCSF